VLRQRNDDPKQIWQQQNTLWKTATNADGYSHLRTALDRKEAVESYLDYPNIDPEVREFAEKWIRVLGRQAIEEGKAAKAKAEAHEKALKSLPPPTQRSFDGIEMRQDMKFATPTENEWQHTGEPWLNATDEFSYVLHGMKPLEGVTQTGKGAHYRPWNHGIEMQRYKVGSTEANYVWRHEYGHAIDWNGGQQQTSVLMPTVQKEAAALMKRSKAVPKKPPPLPTFGGVEEWVQMMEKQQREKASATPPKLKKELTDDYKIGDLTGKQLAAFVNPNASSIKDLTEPQRDRLEGVASLLEDGAFTNTDYWSMPVAGDEKELGSTRSKQDVRMFADFVGALTLNKIGLGHSATYYKKQPTYRAAEMFANYVCLTQAKHGNIYRKMFHKMAPESCAGFDRILRDTAARGHVKYHAMDVP
jgi:hypothetical protein